MPTNYTYQKLSAVEIESNFTSTDSQHIIVEDGGNIRRIPKNALDNKTPITTDLSASSTDTEVPSAKAVYDALNSITPTTTTKVKEYGIRKRIDSILPDFERVGDAVGLRANAYTEHSEGKITNDFDSIYPWSHIRRCNLSDDGKVLAYEGDINYSTNGYVWLKDDTYNKDIEGSVSVGSPRGTPFDAGLEPTYGAHCYSSNHAASFTAVPAQVMVEIPRFYQKYETPGDGYEYWWIRENAADGYRCSPLFENRDSIYISAYTLTEVQEGDMTKAASISGAFPVSHEPKSKLRELARSRGDGWELPNIAYYCDIIQPLMLVEFATYDFSAIMFGYSFHRSGSSMNDVLSSSEDGGSNIVKLNVRSNGKVLVPDLSAEKTYIVFCNTDRTSWSTPRLITNIDLSGVNPTVAGYYAVDVSFDGEPIEFSETGADGSFCVALGNPAISGITDQLPASSGQKSFNTSMVWRGVENVYSNVMQHIEGVNVLNNIAYLTLNPSKYVDLVMEDLDDDYNIPSAAYDYVLNQGDGGYKLPAIGGKIYTSLGYNKDIPWARLPVETENNLATTTSTGLTDVYFADTGVISQLSYGGNLSNFHNNGLFSYAANHCVAENQHITNQYSARIVY